MVSNTVFFMFIPNIGEMIQFDFFAYFLQMGWWVQPPARRGFRLKFFRDRLRNNRRSRLLGPTQKNERLERITGGWKSGWKLYYRTFHSWWSLSKISHTYPWKIPRTFHQQFMKEFLSLWGFGEVWGIFPGYVGKVNEFGIEFLPQVCGLSSGWLFVYFFKYLGHPSGTNPRNMEKCFVFGFL